MSAWSCQSSVEKNRKQTHTLLTLMIVVGGMQCVKRSYNLARTCMILCGERSSIISFAITSIRASQSGGGIGVLSVTS